MHNLISIVSHGKITASLLKLSNRMSAWGRLHGFVKFNNYSDPASSIIIRISPRINILHIYMQCKRANLLNN